MSRCYESCRYPNAFRYLAAAVFAVFCAGGCEDRRPWPGSKPMTAEEKAEADARTLKALRARDAAYEILNLPEVRILLDEETAEVTGIDVTDSSDHSPFVDTEMVSIRKIDDEVLERFKNFPHLVSLKLNGTAITDDGLAHLATLRRLRNLNLSNTAVTDVGVMHLKRLTKLQTISLTSTSVGDGALETIGGLPDMREIRVANTKVTDAGLSHLKNPLLNEISFHDTAVTDEGLRHLAELQNLLRVKAGNTSVTDEGIDALQAALPACKISW